MEEDNIFLGALIDERPIEEVIKDFSVAEAFASAAPVDWKEKKDDEWRTFKTQDQDGSGSCVAQTIKKLAQIQLYLKEGSKVEFSATPIYQKRTNKPASGMIGNEAFEVWRKDGITLEALVPSTKMSDNMMDTIVVEPYEREIGRVFCIGGHVGIPSMDFETVASVIQQTGKGVMVWFYFRSSEWKVKFPKVLEGGLNLYSPTTARHSVAAVDFGLINGKKYIKIEDSAHFGGLSERWVSEEWFNARNFYNRYAMDFTFQDSAMPAPEPTSPKPTYKFTKPLEFISLDVNSKISNLALNEAQKQDVIALQDILKYEGLFPTNTQSTGYYGAMTAKAVYNWQKKHAVALLSELDEITPRGGRIGEKSLKSLNAMYG